MNGNTNSTFKTSILPDENDDFSAIYNRGQSATSVQAHISLPAQPNFSDASIRLGFLRKIYGIFTAQVLTTLILIVLTNFITSIRCVIQEAWSVFLAVAFVFAFVIFLILFCNKPLMKIFPANLILLGLFTLTFGFGVAVLATLSEQNHVVYAFGILLCPCAVVLLYSSVQSKFDLKWYGHLLIVLTTVSLISLLLYYAFPPEEPGVIVVCALASLGLSTSLAIYTQAIMSGDCCHFRPENYVAAALSIFLIVTVVFMIVLFILMILGGGSCEGGGGGGGDGCDGCNVIYCGTCAGTDHTDGHQERNV